MAQSKIEKIASIDDEIKQLRERQKRLLQQHNAKERKDRTKRLCKRMGLFESMLPDTIPLTDEQFKIFLEKAVVTEPSRRLLDSLTAQNVALATPQGAETATQGNNAPLPKTTTTAQGSHADEGVSEGNTARGNGLAVLTLVEVNSN